MNTVLLPALVFLGVAVGASLVWLVGRGRMHAAVEAALARADASSQGELGQLRERVRAAEELKRADQTTNEELQRQVERLRNALDAERDETAKLTERASRVPVLEQDVLRFSAELRTLGADILRISSDASQKGQAVVSLSQQVSELEAVSLDLSGKLDQATEALAGVNERRAALEEQAGRIPGLERDLTTATAEADRLGEQLAGLRETAAAETARLVAEREAHALARGELALEKSARAAADAEVGRLNGDLAELRTKLDAERESGTEKLVLLMNAKEALTDQFKTLATDILEEKSKRFAEQNQATIGQLLDPLRTQLTEFKGKVEEVYVREGQERFALGEQVKQLVTLNRTLSQDAQNLTDALKGNAQVQGAWGEWVLEEMLTSSGLMKGEHYVLQDSKTRDDGTRARPDALINLPGGRQLVVDSKVSLVAYEQYSSGKSDEDRTAGLRGHLDSMKRHITGLSGREYQKLYPTMDFVMMFVPLEPAFMLAAVNDKQLFTQAWEKNVLLVSPSTLLFVLRTVAYLWRQEDQNRNAQAIAERGSLLYDKLCEFMKDLEVVGQKLDQAKDAYGDAAKKLHTGRGNLVSQAEKLTSLGVKGSKKMPPAFVQLSGPEAGIAGELASRAAQNTPHDPDAAAPPQPSA